jgi:hypothetical protein
MMPGTFSFLCRNASQIQRKNIIDKSDTFCETSFHVCRYL